MLPARVGVDVDEALVLGRQLVAVAVPLQEALLEVVGLLDERHLELQPGRGRPASPTGSPNWVMTTCCGLVDDVERAADDQQDDEQHDDRDDDQRDAASWLHLLRPSESSGSRPFEVLVEDDLALRPWAAPPASSRGRSAGGSPRAPCGRPRSSASNRAASPWARLTRSVA